MSTLKTNVTTLKNADWNELTNDVVTRIKALEATVKSLEENDANDLICNDLIYPNLEILAEFCANVDLKPTGRKA